MYRIILSLIPWVAMFLMSCTSSSVDRETWKQEIVATEKAFSEMAGREGVAAAFVAYAADSVTLLRGNELIRGKAAVREAYAGFDDNKNSLSWAPDFVEVSSSGDLGYTYGKYVYTLIDSLDQVQSSEGIFHTVWKRQPDGSWKFVWD